MSSDPYMDEVVTRSAPRWVWDLVDETLECDASSRAFDPKLRSEIRLAIIALGHSCQNPQIDRLSKSETMGIL